MDCPNCKEELIGLRTDGEVARCTKCGTITCALCILKHLHDKHNSLQMGMISLDGEFIPTEDDNLY